jgi:hypothetical protein
MAKPNLVKASEPTQGVTERALIQRINRVLPLRDTPADIRGLVLKIARTGSRYYLARGRTRRQENVDIDTLGRRLSVLKPFEYLPGHAAKVAQVAPLPKDAGASWPSNAGAIRGWAQPTPNQMAVMRRTVWLDVQIEPDGSYVTAERDVTK